MLKENIKNFNRSASDSLSRIYELKYSPVGIKFVKPGEDVFNLVRAANRETVCAYIKAAAQGKSFYLDKDCIACAGGLKWLGFPSRLAKTFLYPLFLGGIEKVKSSPELINRFIEDLPHPPREGLYEKLLFAPLQNCPFEPDVVIIITNPKQAYRILVTAYLDDYRAVKITPLSSACHGVASIPFVTGDINVNMIDPISRELGKYNDDEVLVGIPIARFQDLVRNLGRTPFGSKKESPVTKVVKKTLKYLPR